MRPLRLTISGFTCFNEQQQIDFTALDLFAIAGPTGAGKTSILDAMVFALYGEVPRMGAQGLGELISLGMDRASAVLDFAVGATSYRVARRIRRRGAAQTQLARLDGDRERPLAEGVRDVDHAVRNLLGIDAVTFLQAVVLPQGRFADFLASRAGERRAMLRALLQLEVYERMRERALQRSRAAEQLAAGLRSRLDDDFGNANPGQLDEITTRLESVAVERQRAAEATERARLDHEALERSANAWALLRAARDGLARVDGERAAVERDDARRARAERARPLLELLELARTAAARHEIAAERAADLQRQLATAAGGAAAAREAADDARARAVEIVALRLSLARLEQLAPLQVQRAEWQRRWTDAQRLGREARIATSQAAGELARATRELDSKAAEIEQISAMIVENGHDEQHLRRLSEALAPAAQLVARQRDLDRVLAQLEDTAEAIAAHARSVAAATSAADAAARRLATAAARHRSTTDDLEAARRDHAAQHLRAGLSAGAECPVCLQSVQRVPLVHTPAALELAIDAELAARLEHDSCSRNEQAERARLAELEVTSASIVRRRDELCRELDGIANEIDDGEHRLRGLLGSVVAVAGALAPRIAPAHRAAQARADRHDELVARRDVIERIRAGSANAIAMATQRRDSADRDRDRADRDARDATKELAALDAEIRAISPTGEPDLDRAQISSRIDALVTAVQDAEQRERATATVRRDLELALTAAEVADRSAASERAAAQQRAAAAVGAARFSDDREVRAAVLSEDTCHDIERQVRAWRDAYAVAAARVSDLEQQVGSTEVTSDAVAAARQRHHSAGEHLAAQVGELGRLEREHTDLTARIAKATVLREQLSVQESEHAVFDQLARDLRTDQLQAYLLEGTFREIVDGASVRLMELSSGRYTLDYAEDQFWVIDHDNARERRRAETLSGGETFLTALSLALQLSEQVQRAAGAVRLDSLFIDEGFGTLDPETLTTVSDAIQQLARDNRMVGIITHVQELTAALPARIEVRRGATGSKIEVVSEA